MVKFWRIFRKSLLIGGIVFVFLCLTVALLTYIYEDDLKDMAVKEVNKNLQAKVIIKGEDIHLTFFSSFPNVAIAFENFKIMEPGKNNENKMLAQVGLLNFQFSPMDLINKHYHINGILLKNAVLNLRKDRNGLPNYLILKPDTVKARIADKNAEKATPLDLQLKHIKLKNVNLGFNDEQNDAHISLTINDLVFSGNFTDMQFRLNTSADLLVHNLTLGKQKFLADKKIVVEAGLTIDKEKSAYSVNNFKLKLEKSVFSVAGLVSKSGKDYNTNITVKGEDANIQTILSLLPGKMSAGLKDYQSTGEVSFEGKISGLAGRGITPGIDFGFRIINATVHDQKHSLGLESVNLSGGYTNGKDHSARQSVLHIDKFSARLNGHDLSIRFKMDNFEDPTMDVYVKSELNLKDLHNFMTIPGIDSLAGELAIDAGFDGKLSDLNHYNTINRTRLNGKMTLKNVSLKSDMVAYAYRNLNGYFETNGNDLSMKDFSGRFGHSDFKLNGEFKNLASFLFLPNQRLQANTTLESHLLNFDDFILKQSSSSATAVSAQKGESGFSLPLFMAFNFKLVADKMVMGKWVAENISGQASVMPHAVQFDNLQMGTMGGKVILNGNILENGTTGYKTRAHVLVTKIDVKQGFYEMGNFGQTYFTDKYIQGKLDATIDFSANMNRNLEMDMKSIICLADITVYDGEINNFPPLISLGKYLKVKSLDNIQFSEYSNKLYIKDSKIEIPKMDIKSSAMNMTLSGTHSFDNIMDYSIKLNMSQLLFGNKKNYEDEFGEVEVDQRGGVNVYLTMKGPVSNYKIKYDTKNSVKSMGKGLEDEKVKIQEIFKSNSPNAKPGEDLNKPTDEYEFEKTPPADTDTKTPADEGDNPPPKKKISTQDSARNKAFDNFRKKIKKGL